MKTDDKNRDEKLQPYHLEKLINMNFLQVKIYYLLIKEEGQNKLGLLTFSLLVKSFEKQIKTTEDQERHLKSMDNSQLKITMKKSLQRIQNKKDFLKNVLIREKNKYQI